MIVLDKRTADTALADFLRSYITTALWASSDEDGPLDLYFSPEDIHPDTLSRMRKDCFSFLLANTADIEGQYDQAGHDFWMTRNRTGAGFWDGDWSEDVGWRLTASALSYGEYDLYVGDDGMIHGA